VRDRQVGALRRERGVSVDRATVKRAVPKDSPHSKWRATAASGRSGSADIWMRRPSGAARLMRGCVANLQRGCEACIAVRPQESLSSLSCQVGIGMQAYGPLDRLPVPRHGRLVSEGSVTLGRHAMSLQTRQMATGHELLQIDSRGVSQAWRGLSDGGLRATLPPQTRPGRRRPRRAAPDRA
jgi:hypothetical protein